MHRIIAKKVMMNLTTRTIDIVQVSIFDREGRETETRLMPGRLFPNDLKEGDEITFIQKSKIEQVENLARLGEAIG